MPRKKVRAGADAAVDTHEAQEAVSMHAAHTGRKNLRGKRGGLKEMPDMPLDMLLEILSHLLPGDLLNLARTSKPFRALLMSRSSHSLWKASRKLVEGLPDCPVHLSEPAYANLVFSPHCHSCLKSNTQSIIWEFSARYCSTCKKHMTVTTSDASPHCEFLQLIFRASNDSGMGLLNWVIFPGKRQSSFHIPQIQQLKRAWDELHEDAASWAAFEAEQKERVRSIESHVSACRKWAWDRADTRAGELDGIRATRLQMIVGKLRDMGFGEELDKLQGDLSPLSDQAHVRLAKNLTERGWQKIRDELAQYMQQLKEQRLVRERNTVIRSRLKVLHAVIAKHRRLRNSTTEFFARFTDYAMMPEFRELIEAPSDQLVGKDAFKLLCMLMPVFNTRWIFECVMALRALLLQALAGTPATEAEEILDLAIAILECTACRARMMPLEAIAHRCTRDAMWAWVAEDPADQAYVSEVRIVDDGHGRAWHAGCFRVPDLEKAREVVRMCGMDPDQATVQEMEELDPRLVVKGELVKGKRQVMTWQSVLLTGHVNGVVVRSGWQLELLSGEDKRRAVELEDAMSDRFKVLLYSHCWHCALCDHRFNRRSYMSVWNHVIVKHSKTGLEADEYMYVHPDVEYELAKRVVLLPPA